MIYFYSDVNKTVKGSRTVKLKDVRHLKFIDTFFTHILTTGKNHNTRPLLGYDLETTGLDPYVNAPLLIILGDKKTQFVIDCTSKEITTYVVNLLKKYNDAICLIGHNLKFDYKMSMQHWGYDFKVIYDTQLAEQRLNMNKKLRARLDIVLMRNLGWKPDAMDKDVRMQFVGGSKDNFNFTNDQIDYAAGDISPLYDLYDVQMKLINKYKMNFLLDDIEFKLSRVLGLAELRGYVFNTNKWRDNINENKEIAFNTQISLDKEVIRLRDIRVSAKNKILMTGGKWCRVRNKPINQINIGLFGEPVTQKALTGVSSKPKVNIGNINYGSSTQIVEIFAKLRAKMPTKKGGYYVPKLDNNYKVIKRKTEDAFTTNSVELSAFLIVNYDSPMKDFLKLLSVFKGAQTEINNFGENYIDKINPVSRKIHTIYGQCFTANGRLNSGGGRNQPDKFNNQNVPAKNKLRTCFGTEKNYKVVTCDLSGAEITVMASKAQDKRLLELSGDDIHSHMAMAGWKKIYKERFNVAKSNWINGNLQHNEENKEFIRSLYDKAKNLLVSKEVNNKEYRKPCKNLTFGSVYGCHDKKAGKTLNVSKFEGGIYINSIKAEIPDTFKMVEDNVKRALRDGYLVLNTRTNSRIWFPAVLDAKKFNYELDFMDKVGVDGQARNIPISGTQADMLKETMVELQDDIDKNNWDVHLLGQVHDELIVDFRDNKEYDFFPQYLADKMCEVSNRYLDNFKMGADFEVGYTWIK